MLEQMDGLEETSAGRRRLVNTVSLLLPAKVYKLACSWTTERPLPAIEEFACRLVLLFDGVTPFELGQYFGLTTVEQDGLVESLLKKRLVEVALDGKIRPSSVLQVKTRGTGGVPTLTTYETHDETAIFDLLTLQLMPRRSYQGVRYGLPEVPPPEGFNKIGPDQIVEQFSRQYRAHLDNTRTRRFEAQKTRLYKVGYCRQERTVQIPIDMEISMEVVRGEGARVYRDVVERVGEVRKRALSNDLEAKIADYLGKLAVPVDGFSSEDFCEAVGDEVLLRYCRVGEFDLSSWLSDRDERKTGYGDQDTRGLLGPVYLNNNRVTVCNALRKALRSSSNAEGKGYWYAAHIPLWASNGTDLSLFIADFQKEMSIGRDKPGELVTLFNTRDVGEKKILKKAFSGRLPHAVSLWGSLARDRVELLVVPGILGVAQYHVQPSDASAVTVPVGHLTTDPDRVARIASLLKVRVEKAWNYEVLWSTREIAEDPLIDEEWFGLTPMQSSEHRPRSGRNSATIRWKSRRSFRKEN